MPQLSVDTRLKQEIARVKAGGDNRAERTERVVSFADQEMTHAHLDALDDSLAEVVAAGIAQHNIKSLSFIYAARLSADHDDELAFKVDFEVFVRSRIDDRLVWSNHRGRRFHEQERRDRALQLHLFNMRNVVETGSENSRRINGREKFYIHQGIDLDRSV